MQRSLPERRREELFDLLLVDRLATSRDGARRLAAGVERVLALVVLGLVRGGHNARADVRPRAVVERLLLAPEQVRVGVFVKMGRQLYIRSQRIATGTDEAGYGRGRRGTERSAQPC